MNQGYTATEMISRVGTHSSRGRTDISWRLTALGTDAECSLSKVPYECKRGVQLPAQSERELILRTFDLGQLHPIDIFGGTGSRERSHLLNDDKRGTAVFSRRKLFADPSRLVRNEVKVDNLGGL